MNSFALYLAFGCRYVSSTDFQKEVAMELRVGGVYRTRNGRKAWVLQESASHLSGVVCHGDVFTNCSWRSNGYCFGKSYCEDDIISEWKEPRIRKVYVYENRCGERWCSFMQIHSCDVRVVKTITINLENDVSASATCILEYEDQ